MMVVASTAWTTVRTDQLISDGVLEIGDGYRAKNSEMGQRGLPFARAGNINGGFHFEDADILDESSIARAGEKISCPGDIVFTSKGTVGRFAFVNATTQPFVYSPQLCFWRVKDACIIDPRFLFCWMRGYEFMDQVNQVKGLTDMADYVNLRDQRLMKITLPPLPIQRKIAAILSAYDDLIEKNTRRIAILEEMAQALYREWFVHFRFPGHQSVPLVDSPLGPIPQGWQVVKLGDVVKLERKGIDPVRHPDEIFAHYSIPAFDEGKMPAFEAGDAIKSSKFMLPTGCTLVSKINPRIPRVWLPILAHPERAIASTEFLVLVARPGFTREYVYSVCSAKAFQEDMAGRAMGTSTSHQRIKPDDFLSLPTLQPVPEMIEAFTNNVSPMLAQVILLRERNANLRRTRDLLLPKLVSGEMDVARPEIAAEEETD